MIYWKLFAAFFQIGLFSFGGGYAVLALIRQIVVQQTHWLTSAEFIDIVAISQSTPGPIAVNAATFIGYRLAGISGACLATVAVILPSFTLMLLLAKWFYQWQGKPWLNSIFGVLRPTTLGLIATAAWLISRDSIQDWKSVVIFLGIVVLRWKTKLGPIQLTLLGGLLGIVLYSF